MRIDADTHVEIYTDFFEVISDEDVEKHVESIINQVSTNLYTLAYEAKNILEERLERLIQFCNTGRIEG
ncbi:MAG: hypothetical protein ACXW1Z_19840 [Methylobacter sp.]